MNACFVGENHPFDSGLSHDAVSATEIKAVFFFRVEVLKEVNQTKVSSRISKFCIHKALRASPGTSQSTGHTYQTALETGRFLGIFHESLVEVGPGGGRVRRVFGVAGFLDESTAGCSGVAEIPEYVRATFGIWGFAPSSVLAIKYDFDIAPNEGFLTVPSEYLRASEVLIGGTMYEVYGRIYLLKLELGRRANVVFSRSGCFAPENDRNLRYEGQGFLPIAQGGCGGCAKPK
ncbi:hypothetical protein C8J57DRAFT_1221413 [Mycena rebaudengoi]|nr:hypothetical protein C8J57DRAFT_1221413 [Mycena rebaudengoi]